MGVIRSVIFLSCCLLVCGLLPAQQAPEVAQTFAVATIKPSASSAPNALTGIQIRGSRFATQGTTFLDVFKYAYSVHPDQLVGGPGWLRTEKFDILADPETEKRPSSDQMKAMVRQLLEERFHLVMHRAQNNLSAYAILKTTDSPKFTKSTSDPSGIPVVGYSPSGELEVINATMSDFATFMQRFVLDRPAIDQTGITGRFDLVLHWMPDNLGESGKLDNGQEGASAFPGLFTAMKEQLGLKLQPTKADIDVFVIDHVEQPSDN